MSLFNRLLRRKGRQTSFHKEEETLGLQAGEKDYLTFDTENLAPETRQVLWQEIAKVKDLTIYEGTVEHGYSLGAVSTTGQCPRCHAETRQQYANFIYATNIAPRVMFAPAGFFCAECPTVIIDEAMIVSGIAKKEFSFQGLVGIDHEGRKRPDLFKTWNGRKTVYILDEDGEPMGISTSEPQPTHRQMAKISKNRGEAKRKRRLAKEGRRRNRRN